MVYWFAPPHRFPKTIDSPATKTLIIFYISFYFISRSEKNIHTVRSILESATPRESTRCTLVRSEIQHS